MSKLLSLRRMARRPAYLVSVILLATTVSFGQQQPQQPPPPSPQSAQAGASKGVAQSLGLFVYPKGSQNPQQQQKDEGECFAWAKGQTGIDPLAPPQQSASGQKPATPKGGGAKGAAGGAATGAAIGGIAGDAGQGAAIGATAGAVHGRRQQKKAGKQAQQQAQANATAQQQQVQDTFKKAFSTCMDGRDYSVK